MGNVDLPENSDTQSVKEAQTAVFRDLPANEDLQQAIAGLLNEETGLIIRYFEGKLPPNILEDLEIKDYIRRHCRELLDRYSSSDDNNAAAVLTRRTASEIAEMLRSMGGACRFNTGEIEKADITDTAADLELEADNLLRRIKAQQCGTVPPAAQTAAGAFFRSNTSGSVVKCIFRDNVYKPTTVTDAKVAINILDTELIAPIFYQYAAAKYLITDLVSRHIIDKIDREISVTPSREGSINLELENLLARLLAENVWDSFNLAEIRANVVKSSCLANIRSFGFDAAVHILCSLLDSAHMDYQFIENSKNSFDLLIREYAPAVQSGPVNAGVAAENAAAAILPDEHYEIRLRYFDSGRLAEECDVYDTMLKKFEDEVQHLWDLIEVIYQDSKSVFKVNDFEDLAKKNKSRIRDLIKKKNGEPLYDISGEPDLDKNRVRVRLARMHERLRNMFEFLYPIERRVMEERLDWLEKEYSRLELIINPRHLLPGLLIDIDMTSIKRKKTTLDSMAAVLNEFIPALFAAFQDSSRAFTYNAHTDEGN